MGQKRECREKTSWWFKRLITSWGELPHWWSMYGYAWKEALSSTVELVFILISPILSLLSPLFAALVRRKNSKRARR